MDRKRIPSELVLPRGRGVDEVVRIGNTVRRATGPWTPTVHAYLRYLEDAGFAGAPRVLGIEEEGREIITYIEGVVPHDADWQPGFPNLWPDELRGLDTLGATGALLRELHEASKGFVPTDPVWREHEPIGPLEGEIVCHGDIGQHNTVYRDCMPVGFIDWDGASPNLPILEFVSAAWPFVPLIEDLTNRNHGFPSREEAPERFASFARAYGETDRAKILWAFKEAILRGTQVIRYWPLDAAGAAVALERSVAALKWLDREGEWIVSALD